MTRIERECYLILIGIGLAMWSIAMVVWFMPIVPPWMEETYRIGGVDPACVPVYTGHQEADDWHYENCPPLDILSENQNGGE